MKNNEIEDIRKRWGEFFNALQDYEEYWKKYSKFNTLLESKYLQLEPEQIQSRQDVKDLLYHEDRQNARLILALSALHQIKDIVDNGELAIRPWGIQAIVDDALDSITKSLKEDGYDDTSTD